MPPAAEPSRSSILAALTLLAALRRCRVVVSVVLLLGVGLSAAPQATDLLITLGQSGSPGAWLGLAVGAAWLALNAGFWSRFALAAAEPLFPTPSAQQRWVMTWLPRLLASSALAAVALGLRHAARAVPPPVLRQMGMVSSGIGRLEAAAILALAAAVAVLAFRRRGSPPTAARPTPQACGSAAWWMLALSAGVAAAGMAAYGTDPVLTARALPPATTVLFAAAGLMCGGTLLVQAGTRTGVPILFLVFAAAALLAVLRDRDMIADNHDIRRLAGALRHRPGLDEAFERFLAATGPAFGTAPVPVVLVAASGGGIAASYWTATVLGDLADASPAFARQVFAISGVSGGALGALEFVAARAGPPGCSDPADPQPNPARTMAGFRPCQQLALGEDFLGPALGALLYPDLMQRFLPVPVFADRAVALELAWEARWRAVFGDDRLTRPFLDLWNAERPWPALFLNGTSLVTGGRLITSNLALWPPGAPTGRPGLAGPGADLLATLGAEIRASTAASDSARFPYISPLGIVRGAEASGRATDAVADGGYFESLGATTLLDALDLLDGLARRDGRHVRFIVLQIVNDPTVGPDAGSAVAMGQAPTSLLPLGLTGPATILLRTRVARGLNASEALARRVLTLGGIYVPVRLGQSPTGATAPLGWSLSLAARALIDGQWTQACRDRLLADAGFAGAVPPGPESAAGNPMQMHIAAMWSGAACGAVAPDARPPPVPPSRP